MGHPVSVSVILPSNGEMKWDILVQVPEVGECFLGMFQTVVPL